MDSVTQQTAASAEESASASEELTAQAEQMRRYVGDLAAAIGGRRDGGGGAVQQEVPIRQGAESQPARLQITAGRHAAPARLKPAPTAKRPRPEQIIPLEDDGFKDF